MCVTVVQWSRSCLHLQINRVRLPATLFSVCLYRFYYYFFCLVLVFPFRLFFFILTTDPAGHSLGSIYILNLSPEYYFGKGISRVLDRHYWPSLRPEKTTSCQVMSPLLSNSWNFFNVSWHHDKQHTVHQKTVLVYTQHPVIHWRNLDLPFVHRLNYQYYYPKISKK